MVSTLLSSPRSSAQVIIETYSVNDALRVLKSHKPDTDSVLVAFPRHSSKTPLKPICYLNTLLGTGEDPTSLLLDGYGQTTTPIVDIFRQKFPTHFMGSQLQANLAFLSFEDLRGLGSLAGELGTRRGQKRLARAMNNASDARIASSTKAPHSHKYWNFGPSVKDIMRPTQALLALDYFGPWCFNLSSTRNAEGLHNFVTTPRAKISYRPGSLSSSMVFQAACDNTCPEQNFAVAQLGKISHRKQVLISSFYAWLGTLEGQAYLEDATETCIETGRKDLEASILSPMATWTRMEGKSKGLHPVMFVPQHDTKKTLDWQ